MRNIYISFLGAGKYQPANYHIDGNRADQARFVQTAELQLAEDNYFDKIFIVMTKTSKEKHFEGLKTELKGVGIHEVNGIEITEDFLPESQWSWFENILSHIDHGDELTVDLTHGYRIIPIVFSTALNFLQKARDITIKSVYYGAYEADKELSPIVDMKDFYIINEWSDAVLRLVEDADTGKLSRVAMKDNRGILGEFEDPAIVEAFDRLTESLKNVDIHTIRQKASHALDLIDKKEKAASSTGKILLGLVKDKFVSLISDEPASGRYDFDYFSIQLEVIRLLLDHKLFMQAYTVMRECIASLGLIEMKERAKIYNSVGRKQRQKAEVFVNMLFNDEAKWDFGNKQEMVDTLLPLYNKFKDAGIIDPLREVSRELLKYRNGFDHAWTANPEAFSDIETKGEGFHQKLSKMIAMIEKNNLFPA